MAQTDPLFAGTSEDTDTDTLTLPKMTYISLTLPNICFRILVILVITAIILTLIGMLIILPHCFRDTVGQRSLNYIG